MKDLKNLFKDQEQKKQDEKARAAQTLAKELFKLMVEKNLQVSDAMLTIKFLQDTIAGLSGKKIQEMYLNHL